MTIFALCPANTTTGGPEALHQFVHKARRQGFDARIVYLPAGSGLQPPDAYRCYDIEIDRPASYTSQDIVIVPEVMTTVLPKHPIAKYVLWWLSVDNFFVNRRRMRGQQSKAGSATAGLADFDFRSRPWLWHAAQSEYARLFLEQRGVGPIGMLTDYVRRDLIPDSDDVDQPKKEDLIVYNPKKGWHFTERLMKESPAAATWVPLENMTPAEVGALLNRAKIYIDFGEHPGRDRIPREAAIRNCCVVTGLRGAAANTVDIPIPPTYKIDETAVGAFEQINNLLVEILSDHATHITGFSGYRDAIREQESAFEKEVARLLSSVASTGSESQDRAGQPGTW